MNANIFEKANQIVRNSSAAYLGVIDENGSPHVSTVSPIKPEGIFEIYFSTNMGSNNEKRLSKDNRASLCFRMEYSNVTLVGETEIVTDQETKSCYWLDWFKDHYESETDPNYIIVRFTTKRLSLWIDNESTEFTINELLSVQSRCGLLCDGCTYKSSHGCKGCITQNGKPFWGECDVAKCCISKGYSHCGECPDMPCDDLRNMSCGGDDECDKPKGARIAVCKAWAAFKGN